MENKAGSQEGFVRSLLISVALFIFGDKITTVAEILLRGYDLLNESNSKEQFILEMSLLGLAVGVSSVIYLTSLKKEHDPKEDQAILVGAIVGLVAGLLEITKAAISLPGELNEFSWRAYYFFLIYLTIFFLPALPFALRSGNWMTAYKHFLHRLSKVFLLSIVLAVAVQLLVGGVILLTDLVQTTYPIEHAGKELVFNPLSLVILGAMFNCSTFYFRYLREHGGGFLWRWESLYFALAFVFSAGYFYLFLLDDKPPLIADSVILTCFGFAALAVSPLIANKICFRLVVLENYPLIKQCSVYFGTVTFLMMIGLANAVSTEFFAKLAVALLMGTCGIAMAVTQYLILVRQEKIHEPDAKA